MNLHFNYLIILDHFKKNSFFLFAYFLAWPTTSDTAPSNGEFQDSGVARRPP